MPNPQRSCLAVSDNRHFFAHERLNKVWQKIGDKMCRLEMGADIMMRKLINIFLFTVYFLLTACGTKGPLYIPEQRYPQKTEAPEKSGSQEIAPANQ